MKSLLYAGKGEKYVSHGGGPALITLCPLQPLPFTGQARCGTFRRKAEAQGRGAECCVLAGFPDLRQHVFSVTMHRVLFQVLYEL